MARPPTTKKQNRLEIDTLEYIDRLGEVLKKDISEKHDTSMKFKVDFKQETHKWRAELNIKIDAQNLVLKKQDEILASFKEILAKQDVKLRHLEKAQDEIKATLNTHSDDITNLKNTITTLNKNIKLFFQIFSGIGAVAGFAIMAWSFVKGFIK